MRSTCLESTVCVCDGTAGIIVEMTFDIARDDTSKGSYKIVYLSWVCTSNLLVRFHVTWRDVYSIGDSDTVDTDFIDSAID